MTRRELLGKGVRWTFVGTVAASLIEGAGGVDPKGRCNCLFCRLERGISSEPLSFSGERGRGEGPHT